MRQYILKRLLLAVPTLIGVSLIVFFMVRLLPGDIVQQIAGDNQLTPEFRASRHRDRTLRVCDKPACSPSEYFILARRASSRLDFGQLAARQAARSATA